MTSRPALTMAEYLWDGVIFSLHISSSSGRWEIKTKAMMTAPHMSKYLNIYCLSSVFIADYDFKIFLGNEG